MCSSCHGINPVVGIQLIITNHVDLSVDNRGMEPHTMYNEQYNFTFICF